MIAGAVAKAEWEVTTLAPLESRMMRVAHSMTISLRQSQNPFEVSTGNVDLESIKVSLTISLNAIDHFPIRTRHTRTSITAAGSQIFANMSFWNPFRRHEQPKETEVLSEIKVIVKWNKDR